MRLCIVPCGSRKIWELQPHLKGAKARDAYIGPFAKTCIQYAEKFHPGSYIILSAKHGFMFPDEVIPAPYNVTFKDPETNPITVEKLREQAEEKGLMKYSEIVVIAGREYVDIVRKVFPGKKIITPLRGARGMGEMISAMKKAIAGGIELALSYE
ncbi:MAG: hypothetical protein QW506_00535 [Thermoproteota archaeon]|nr:hypothetical protein [Candidatus Brockarchaeota archaeon]